jgi:acyl carrier protein
MTMPTESDRTHLFEAGAEIHASIENEVRAAIVEVAPDLEPDDLELSIDLHEDVGLDSIDLLNIASAIAERIGFTIPESEISRLNTVGDLVEFIEQHSQAGD